MQVVGDNTPKALGGQGLILRIRFESLMGIVLVLLSAAVLAVAGTAYSEGDYVYASSIEHDVLRIELGVSRGWGVSYV